MGNPFLDRSGQIVPMSDATMSEHERYKNTRAHRVSATDIPTKDSTLSSLAYNLRQVQSCHLSSLGD